MKEEFKKEVYQWIEEEMLVSWNYKVKGIIPLMVVEQPTKNKVRPVLKLNHTQVMMLLIISMKH